MRYFRLFSLIILCAYTSCCSAPPHPIFRPLPKTIHTHPPHVDNPNAIKIAFYNILAQHVSDKNQKDSKYFWKNRKGSLIKLIRRDHPHVLGLCELELNQAKDLEKQLAPKKLLEGYSLIGFAAKTDEMLETMMQRPVDDYREYQEFVGFLYDTNRVQMNRIQRIQLPKSGGQKHDRILVEAHFYDKVANTHFVCLASHFDHLEAESRQLSAKVEIDRIEELQKVGLPCFSLGDRNWGSKANKQELTKDKLAASAYMRTLKDFRDAPKFYGPPGTFPGHIWYKDRPKIIEHNGMKLIDANQIDLCYYSKEIQAIYTYHESGEFDPKTKELLPPGHQGDLDERNFVSDHYYVGGVFLIKTKLKPPVK